MNLTARAVRRVAAVAAVAGAAALTPAVVLAAPGGRAAPPGGPGRTAPPGVSGHADAVSAVPAGFRANSLSWPSASQGRVLGTAPCGQGTCSDVIGTRDGGGTWRLLGTVRAPISEQHPGITEIRFSTPEVGWAFGPRLFRTGDAGRSWAAVTIPGRGKQVLDLAAGPAGAYAVVSPCRRGASPCRGQLSLWRASKQARASWTRIPLDLPASPFADVAVSGATVYVTAEGGANVEGRLYASTDGRHFSPRPSPCDAAWDLTLVQVVPTSATDVAFLCDGDAGFSRAVKTVYRSADTGRTDTFAGRTGLRGIAAELAVSPSGNLAVAAWSNGSFLYINDGHHRAWTRVIGRGDGGAGWNDLTYVTRSQAWVVYAPAAGTPGTGRVYVTRDAGRHWTAARM
jgi:photosystem II stability/assembly factor-like uncharacterized protein